MAIEQRPSAKAGSAGSPEQNIQKTRNYIQETYVELKKTTWPTKDEATRLTSVVIAVILVLGVYMGVLDALFSYLINRFSLLK